MTRRLARQWGSLAVATIAGLAIASPVFGQDPLDLLDGTPRNVQVQVEASGDEALVGQSFGPAVTATYSATGNVGTLIISAEAHEQLMSNGFPPIPDTFTPITIEFDLTTFEATSQPASGQMGSGQIGSAFTQNALDTMAVAGFMGPDVPALFCTSQAQVDNACTFVPMFCGQLCTIVPGAPYDPLTGLVNLVGSETVNGCDGGICSGPFDFFATRGDLLLTEAPAPVAGGSSGGGGDNPCFIATAAYGTPMADGLDDLRAFRDTRLLGNPLGAAFTDMYYRLSPPIADALAQHEFLRGVVRCLLRPFVSD